MKGSTTPSKNHKVRWRIERWKHAFVFVVIRLMFSDGPKILSYLIDPCRQKKSFRYTTKIGLRQIFQLSIVALNRERCHYQSHWIRNFRFFFSYFGFLPLLWTSLSVSDTDFSKFFLKLQSGNIPKNDFRLRMVKALPFIHQPDGVAQKAKTYQQLIGEINLFHGTHVKKYRIFSLVFFTAFLRAGNPSITPYFTW